MPPEPAPSSPAPSSPAPDAASGQPPAPRHTIALFLLQGKVGCHRLDAQNRPDRWQHEKLDGEDWLPLTASGSGGIAPALDKLQQRLNLSSLGGCAIHIVCDPDSLGLLDGAPAALKAHGCRHWQVLQWQPLRQRAERLGAGLPPAAAASLPSPAWLARSALPLLQETFSYHDEALAAERQRAQAQHDESMQTLRDERNALQAQISQMQAQLNALHRMDAQELLRWLPALYRQPFSVITPHDLALLCGSVERVPEIPSPWPEPAADTLRLLQKNLRALPAAHAAALRRFCRQLPHKLETRPEMQTWLEQEP